MLKLKLKFFLSYPSVDVVKAKEFKNRLLDFPFIDVFMAPDDIPPGVSGANYILKQIQTCDYFIMYVTPNYHESNYTEQEVGAAWAFKKRMIPFIEPGTEVHGVAQTFQIKEIPQLYNYAIATFLLKLYGQFEDPNDFVDYLLEKELRASNSYARSNTIHSLIGAMKSELNQIQTEYALMAFWYNDQVRSTKWIPDMKKFLKSENGFLGLSEIKMGLRDKTREIFERYLPEENLD